VSPATYNQRLAVLSSFYRYAKKLGLLTGENPIDRVARRGVQAYASAVPIDKAALRQRLKAIARTDGAGQRDYAMLAIYVNTGRRLSAGPISTRPAIGLPSTFSTPRAARS